MIYLHWIAGTILALAWFSRIIDAALGMPSVADISRAEWDRSPAGIPRVSIIVPARNEEETIEQGMSTGPTLEIRPGYQFNVMVTEDLVFPGPYKG